MVGLGPRGVRLELKESFSLFRHRRVKTRRSKFAGKSPHPHLDYRVSPLRGGPAMTEKNQIDSETGIKQPQFL
jgi:hypothetical protein